MEEWTKDNSKFNQIIGEASSAIALWRNTGSLVKIKHFPKNTKCIVCNKPATNAEHLVDKARGGNNTKYNVIPVCKNHTKTNHVNHTNPNDWKNQYSPHAIQQIEAHVGTDNSKRINPYNAQNEIEAEELRTLLSPIIENWRTEKGLI